MSPPMSTPICDETRLRPARPLPERKVAGETVLVDPRRRAMFAMNEVGSVVWAGVVREASVGEIVSDLVRRFRVTAETARADVGRFVGELEAAGLAERA